MCTQLCADGTSNNDLALSDYDTLAVC
jgi:hypothetical protein